MSATSIEWNAERMLELATRHASVEGQRRLDDLMDTLIEEPVYEFPVQGLTLRGGASVRRYYRQFFDDYMSRVTGARLLGQWADEIAVAREDAIEVESTDGPELQRVMSVLFAAGDRLGGERIYASDRVVRMMAGEMFDELEPIV
ncbi:MAG: hypothetical protein AAEJ52_13270 [Myxococcota bacterium]